MGKVPVNLNYTVSEETLASCIHQCDIKTVLTSRAFVEKVKLKVPGEVIFLEEVAAKPGSGEEAVRATQRVAPADGLAGALAGVWRKLGAHAQEHGFLPVSSCWSARSGCREKQGDLGRLG
jgi:acyl-CoA synthetase (AMP-forming)/AMP-acid ligase II